MTIGSNPIGDLPIAAEEAAAPPATDDTLLATLQTIDRGIGQVRAARLDGELQ